MDTIFAQATAPGKAGVAVVRISGPDAFSGVSKLCALPQTRKAGLRRIRDLDGGILDTGLVIVFEADASFTGEPVVELQLHGSIAVMAAVLRSLGTLDGFRPAEPGEFTRRALENENLDLSQVEGLADLIDAETEFQRTQAQTNLGGALTDAVQEWRSDLVEASALLEAALDFSDEDLPVDVAPDVLQRLERVRSALRAQMDGYSKAERVRNGFEVAILGAPNAGKSTLLNAIAQRPAALTSEIAGTTRDVIEVRLDLYGLPVTLLDTAGLRDTDDPLEAAGISLAKQRAAAADLRIWLATDEVQPPVAVDLVYRAKDDDGDFGGVSGLTGSGVSEMLSAITERLREAVPSNQMATRDRHFYSMQRAVGYMDVASAKIEAGLLDELTAENLRLSAQLLGELIGAVDVEDLLDHIFSSFCIGK
ncbi:tRNA modification GTPase MnmE [Rhodobacteraceae bacterium THAF1]|uniref:tRNA uridine-5-carboxymethylaminomethyl(34) synthesis GTPase MnmE n=1 Tax=Palleronia sp. THAF1 TaxID=2587842 RepID=UPI000F40881E|nr:tRNA uridine-5-carboxymethylaminomethyl(34) synthesis GTPase MnmE [Palleronia sp. THAF1]QFU10158.1 tRNA modification GTPase MnmE [Palleronia sp. THAF1]VDC16937.1 tRNA modification GTPase MnmE [Rhodobacteraceae bacterium THAF1]